MQLLFCFSISCCISSFKALSMSSLIWLTSSIIKWHKRSCFPSSTSNGTCLLGSLCALGALPMSFSFYSIVLGFSIELNHLHGCSDPYLHSLTIRIDGSEQWVEELGSTNTKRGTQRLCRHFKKHEGNWEIRQTLHKTIEDRNIEIRQTL